MSEAVCVICGGSGWRIVERAGLSGAERCACAQTDRAERLRASSNIPPNYARATLSNFEAPIMDRMLRSALSEVMAYVREFPVDKPQGLLLVGDTGSGKTHLAVGVLKAIIDKGFEGTFFDYQNLLDRIRSGYDRSSGASDREAYQAALDAEVLLLDDLGAHRVTDWVEDTVTAIITHRCNQRKPLIATANLDVVPGTSEMHKKTLGESIGARAQSRLQEMCRIVRLWGVPDYRARQTRATL